MTEGVSMKKTLLFLSSLSLLAAACNSSNTNAPQTRSPDNTQVNDRDASGDTLTSGNQSESDADRTITQNIRKAIVADNNLTMLAKNIKIITINGVVTLRGPVNSESEKQAIGNKASQVPGVTRVNNLLEVTKK